MDTDKVFAPRLDVVDTAPRELSLEEADLVGGGWNDLKSPSRWWVAKIWASITDALVGYREPALDPGSHGVGVRG
jgi:hypothetical protein